jgi:acetyl-CoA C-acetyltransferase
MPEAYIIDAVRTPVGKRKGGLSEVHPADLGAHVLKGLWSARASTRPLSTTWSSAARQIGPQAGDIARTCWLVAGLPDSVPGVTIDRQCGSSQQAVHFAAQGVMSGHAGPRGGRRRAEHDAMIPISAASWWPSSTASGDPYSGSRAGWSATATRRSASSSAEMIAEKWDISREDMEAFAYESHMRAARAPDEGRFAREILPYGDVTADEGPRRDTTLEKMAGLKPSPRAAA